MEEEGGQERAWLVNSADDVSPPAVARARKELLLNSKAVKG